MAEINGTYNSQDYTPNINRITLLPGGCIAATVVALYIFLLLDKIEDKLTHIKEKRVIIAQNKETDQALLNNITYKQGVVTGIVTSLEKDQKK